MLKRDPLDEIKEAFKLIANDKTKTITFRDLKYAAEKVGADIPDRDLRSMIEEFDGKGHGKCKNKMFHGNEKLNKIYSHLTCNGVCTTHIKNKSLPNLIIWSIVSVDEEDFINLITGDIF